MRRPPSGNNPLLASVLVLLAVLVLESLLLSLTRPTILAAPLAVRWAITLVLALASAFLIRQTRWLQPTIRPNWWTFGGVTLLVLYSVQLLGDRVRELASPYGLVLALLLAAGAAYLLWRITWRMGNVRGWLAGLGGVAVFVTLYL